MKQVTRRTILAAAPAVLTLAAIPARAQKKYGPGVTDTEIKVGNTGPYSGPASSYSPVPKSIFAWSKMVNDQGGVNGRKINLLSYDDAYTPPKTVEQIRKLVEQDEVGEKKSMIAVEASYETTDPTVDSQIVDMKAKGIDVFVNTAIPKFAAQSIRKAAEIEWKPLHILSSIGASVGATLKPAGFENCKGLISDFYLKDPSDPQWKDDAGFKEWSAFMDKYLPDGDKLDAGNVAGASLAAMTVQVLKQCGDELTRENVMKQAANLHDVTVPMLLPGIKANTSPTDFAPLKQVQMARFTGERWELFGPLITGA